MTNAARRYVFALAALAEAYPRSTGSHRLRSGCELLNTAEPKVELRGGGQDSSDSCAWLDLFKSRERLIAVAKDAMRVLGVVETPVDFTVSKASLKSDFDGVASKANQDSSAGGAGGEVRRGKPRGR